MRTARPESQHRFPRRGVAERAARTPAAIVLPAPNYRDVYKRQSLACSGGVHSGTDAVKALMAGAHSVQIVSALLKHGPGHLRKILDELTLWLTEHEYESMAQLCGSMNHARSPNPSAYERANYIRLLSSFHTES